MLTLISVESIPRVGLSKRGIYSQFLQRSDLGVLEGTSRVVVTPSESPGSRVYLVLVPAWLPFSTSRSEAQSRLASFALWIGRFDTMVLDLATR